METYYAHIENNTRRLKLINQRFGRLLVLEYIGLDKRGNSIWKCQCDCGNVKNIKGGSLQQKRTKSCGCLKGEITAEKWRNSTHSRIKKGQSGRNALFSRYKISAKKRNLEFNLTKEEFERLTQQNCFYCGNEPIQIAYNGQSKRRKEWSKCIYNGIDRKNNSEGYVIENCVPCCKKCNIAKGIMNINEFLRHINKIKEHQNGIILR